MKNLIKQNPVVSFFTLSFSISWVGVLPLIVANFGWITIPLPDIFHSLGALGPFLSAIIVISVISGSKGIEDLKKRLTDWRIGWVWIVVATLSPFLLFTIAFIGVGIVKGVVPDLSKLLLAVRNSKWLIEIVIVTVAYAIGEEVGWRGFAMPRLQRGRTALGATFILAIVWAVWHVPFFFYRFQFSGIATIIGFFVAMMAGAIWLTFLLNSTDGSIFAVATWLGAGM